MRALRYLNQYRNLSYKVKDLEAEIRDLRSQAESVRSSLGGDGTPRSPSPENSRELLILRIADKVREAELMRLEALEVRADIRYSVELVSDPIYRKLLLNRYILLMKWEKITDDLGYNSDEYVRGRLHSKAIEAFQEVLDGKDSID